MIKFIYRIIKHKIMCILFKIVMIYIVISGTLLLLSGCTKTGTQFPKSDISEISTEIEIINTPSEEVVNITSEDDDYIDLTENQTEAAGGIETIKDTDENVDNNNDIESLYDINIQNINIPVFDGTRASVEINDDKPYFNDTIIIESFIHCSEKDELGRCGTAVACLSKETMPTAERNGIGHVKTSGWKTIKYPNVIVDAFLYNRSHLLAYSLSSINDDNRNLITGTRFLNVDGMYPYENEVATYIYEHPDNHVLYRVTPIYKNDDLVASGVIMEAKSMETNDICFCVYCYNEQPGITIDHHTGESEETGENYEAAIKQSYTSVVVPNINVSEDEITYIINKSTKKYHRPDCESVEDIREYNKLMTNQSKEELINAGYEPCKRCNP